MNRTRAAATCFAVIFVACIGGQTRAGDASPSSAGWSGWIDDTGVDYAAFGGETTAGLWIFGPVAEVHASRDGLFGTGRHGDAMTASLGFRSAAKVDSRFGAIYSRLSLSFERTFRTDRHQASIGYSGDRRLSGYAHRSEIDIMKLDADFAMQMSHAVTGFVDYGAEMDLGSGAEHQIVLRLKFDF